MAFQHNCKPIHMKKASTFIKVILLSVFLFIQFLVLAQAPGGVSTGTVRGWKVEYYDGNFGTNFNAFGNGSSNTTPGVWGYAGYITANEFLDYDNTYFGLQYTATVEVPQTGSYSFNIYNVDDHAILYIDGIQRAITTWSGSVGNVTSTVSLTAGDHTILIKYIELAGPLSMNIRWSGPGITANSELDGRFVRVDNAQLAAWYKGSNVTNTPNYSGSRARANAYTNMAPAFSGNGNLTNSSTGWAQYDPSSVNFNPAVRFDADDLFGSMANQNGLAFRSSPRTIFLVNTLESNLAGSGWVAGQGRGSSGQNIVGLWKHNGTQTGMSRDGDANPLVTSTYSTNEPKLLTGEVRLGVGAAASVNNGRSLQANGGTAATLGFTERITNYNTNNNPFVLGGMNGAFLTGYVPEAIYYPFELTAQQKERVNTYLAIKYGITLQHNYLNTSGTVLWNTTTNAAYNNRIVGIGRELAVQGLNQKQSQSQMTGSAGYNFLVLSKEAIAASNDANTGSLSDGDYMIIGDNNGALAAQSTEIPASFSAGCVAARITREWKVQTSGNPGPVTLRAAASGTYLFPAAAAGISLLIDSDGDGDFTTGTVTAVPASSYTAGVATFSNVTIPNGTVITFAWSATSPGGVFTNLALWLKADGELYSDPAGTTPVTDGGTVALWRDGSTLGNSVSQATATNRPTYRNNAASFVNFNPVLQFTMGSSYLQTSAISSALNNNITGFSAHRFAGNTSNWNAIMGSRSVSPSRGGWNLYVTNTTGEHSLWTANSTGWTISNGLVAGILPELLSFSAITGIGQKYLYEKGRQTAADNTGAYLVNTTRQFQVGSNGDDNLNFGGNIYEQIVYSSVLSATDRRKVESYLAIKYGTSLDQTTAQNYLASDGTIIWNGTSNALYKNNIIGIGRDDCSGLMQKQSKSTATGDIIVIGIGSIALSNAANTASFTANKQYLLVGHDAAALTTSTADMPSNFAAISCNARRYAREWKVANTNGANNFTLSIGDTANKIKTSMTNLQLAVDTDGDGNFTTGTVSLFPVVNLSNGVATFNNINLPNGAVFTICWTEAAPGGVFTPSSGTTSIAGVPHLNGLTYKFYKSSGTGYASPLDLSAVSVMPGDLISTGYIDNLTNLPNFLSPYANTQMGIEITGKLYIPTASNTYRFKANAFDDQACIKIDGVTVANATTYASGADLTSDNVNLTAGYHDILIRFGQGGGAIAWNITWNGGSGSTFTAISNASFFAPFSGPSAWYAADDIQLQNNADGTNMTTISGTKWPDMSANANDIMIADGDPRYYRTTTNQLKNYNPSVSFSADYMQSANALQGFALGGLGKSAITVATNTANGTFMTYTSYGVNASGNMFAMGKRANDRLTGFTWSNDYDETNAYYSGTPVTDIVGVTLNAGRALSIYAQGVLRGTGTLAASFNTYMQRLYIGTYISNSAHYTGNMSEIIHYPWALSANELQRINSYLSIKWGTTLNQSTPTNYLSGDGTITWTGNATFKYDITGIGRDDCSALNQLQSTSTDSADMVTISKGNLAATNYDNTSSFSGNKQFVIFGNNNGSISTLNATNMPAALLSISDCYQKLGRVWRVQETGGAGVVQLQLGKSGLFLFNKSYYKPKLLISSSSTDWSSATIVDADSVNNGIVYFGNVTFSGEQYFTVAIIQAAPGGVTANLTLWLAADDGTSTKTDNTAITTWSDLSLQNMHGAGSGSPLYRSGSSAGAANFNPSVSFNGTSQYFTLPTGFGSFEAGTTAFGVLNTNFGTPVNWSRLFHLSTSANNNVVAFVKNNNFPNIGLFTSNNAGTETGSLYTSSNPLAPSNGFNVYGYRIQAGTSGQTGRTGNVFVNGTTAASSSSVATPATILLPTPRSANYVGRGGSAEYLYGYMPELILYNRDLTATERNKINTYLAVKYGRTLDVSTGYFNSAGTAIFNHTTHWNRITAIGRDDCQALEQKQSKSAETGGLVTIGIGGTIATSNDGNTNTFSADKSYAVFGDNNKAATWTGVDNFGNGLVRLNRIWRMKETGTIGTTYIEVPGNSSVLTTKLPASNAASDPVYLVISTSGNFKNAVTMIEMTPDVIGAATKWYISYDFADGDYFTFATKKLCLGPAGITDGLTTWYRADNKSLGAVGSTLPDETGNHILTRNANAATVVAGSAISFNYNRNIALSTSAAFVKGSLNETSFISANAGAMYAVGTSAANLYMFSNNTTNKTGINAAPVFMAGTGGLFTNSALPNIYMANYNGATLSGSNNGTSVSNATVATSLPAAATYSLGIGTYVAGSTFNNGSFAEAFSFNRSLTTAEEQVLNSYLAIKYGQTITHNYYTPDYDGTNASTSTIYDISSYNNRIFGVGVDSTGCFYQKQSTSQLTGSMLKMSIATSLFTENAVNPGTFALDRTYAAAGDDNGSIAAWITGVVPAIYNTGTGNCNQPLRIVRQWKLKATNNQQTVLITIPASSSTATTKLPMLPAGSTKLYMVANQNSDFSVNASQEELEMTFNATSNEWEVLYTLPNGIYKYITFVTKPDLAGLLPIAINTGTQDATSADCNATPYLYYKGATNTGNAIVAINPNNNTWSPTSITIDNTGTHTGGGGTFSNSGNGYYQSTDGLNTYRITKRLHTIVAPGTYDFNDGVLVRLYYTAADTMAMLTDPLPGGGTIQRKGWFKYSGNAAATVASMRPPDPNFGEELTPVAWGTEQGVRYVEFLVNSFSTFGYFAKTTSMVLPVELDYFKGSVVNCENILTWKSGVELNFSHFEIEYSNNGQHFEKVGSEVSRGSGSVYEFKHIPDFSKNFYRLKMIDKDGTAKFSASVSLTNNCNTSAIKIYPNPVKNHIWITGANPGTDVMIRDTDGRIVIKLKTTLQKEKISILPLRQGLYYIETIDPKNHQRNIFKILKD